MRNRVRVRVERESGRVKIMDIWFQDAKTMERKNVSTAILLYLRIRKQLA